MCLPLWGGSLWAADQPYVVFEESTGTLTFSYGEKPAGAYDLNEGSNQPGWYSNRADITKVVFDASFANARPTSCNSWFEFCENLTEITGIEHLNTEEVTDMEAMFESCSSLSSLDLTNFNTAKVTNLGFMFENCSSLSSLDLTNFNTVKVTSMTGMFHECSSLATIYASDKFVTTQVRTGSYMFSGCNNIKGAIEYNRSKNDYTYANYTNGYFTLKPPTAYSVFDAANGTLTFRCDYAKPAEAYDLNEGSNQPGWYRNRADIKKVVFDASFANARPTSCYYWFSGCENLTQIEGLEYLNTEEVTNMSYFFKGCSLLTSLNISNFNTAKVTDMSYMFTHCWGLESLDVSILNTEKVTNMESMFLFCNKLTSLDVSNFKTENVTNMSNMFRGCRKLTSLDVYSFNTEKVTDMLCMFTWCDDLTTIYVSDKFVTTSVQDCVDMFDGCYNLKGAIEYDSNKTDYTYANYTTGYFTLKPSTAYVVFDTTNGTLTFRYDGGKPAGAYDLNEGWKKPEWAKHAANIKKVVFDASFAKARPTSCYSWFRNCEKLTQIEGFEHLNTEEVTDMSWMFMGCSGLTSLDVSHFKTPKVTNMEHLFNRCSGLTSLDVSNFNTENVTNMNCIFFGCSGLTSLDVSHFNTEKVTDMSCMFYECDKLTSLDVSHFNTGNVTNMDFMFFNCSALTLLDLTNFNTAKVVDMGGMLISCSALTTIYVSDKFVTKNVTERGSMFYGCTSLKGAIAYGENKYDDTYANYKTGYFTKQVGMNGSEKIGAAGEVLTAENLVLADDNDFVAYEPFMAKEATYSRSMREGTMWATLCLPFEVSLTGQNFRAFSLLSANEEGTIELKEVETSIAAGVPVIIKMNSGETQLNISASNKEINKDVIAATTEDGKYQFFGLYTKKVFSKEVDDNCYILKGDKLMNPAKLLENTNTKSVGSKAFRAYMQDNSHTAAAGAKMFSIGMGDYTTAIGNLNAMANDNAEYYDLQGHRLNAPQKGVNIVKRGNKTMKVIIK